MLKKLWRNIYYSFPVQLLILHLRNHHLLMGLWLLFLLFCSGLAGKKLGILYLFLDPEYLGQVNFWSYYFVGFAFGGFLMSWNLTTYLLSAQYFPFLASLSRPFTKFIINNFIIPFLFLLVYLILLIHFQYFGEGLKSGGILLYCLGFVLGTFSLVACYSLYFQLTNRDISYYERKGRQAPNLAKSFMPGRRDVDLEYIKQDENRWKVKTYLNEAFRPKIVRSVAHYESSTLKNIFKQNHLNALILQLLSMLLLMSLGLLIDFPAFRIPAGASMFILGSVLAAITGAVTYWFHEWRVTLIILTLLGLNLLTRFDWLNPKNKAFGLDYESEAVPYTYEKLTHTCQLEAAQQDKIKTRAILENWKKKCADAGEDKPKMLILCVSGGGLKAATWAMQVVQTADSLNQGRLLDQTVLITGASGGLMGLAYLRELYYQQQQGEVTNIYDKKYIDNICKDLLNSIVFSIVSNDLFLPWSKVEEGGYTYNKDRGYVFEQQLNENTNYVLDKSLSDYRDAEVRADIPMMYITPSIVNDARRLIISPQNVRFMMMPPVGESIRHNFEVDAVDFRQVFFEHQADSLRFLTALRMNATYPYILPNIHLPSEPEIEVMDAGFLDNYGIMPAARFIQVFQDWILENTSGVVLLQISSSEKIEEIPASGGQGIIESLINPLGIAVKVMERQELEHDNTLGFVYDILGDDRFHLIRFFYRPQDQNKLEAAISFHITAREKEDVLNALYLEENQSLLRQLQDILAPQVQPNPSLGRLDK